MPQQNQDPASLANLNDIVSPGPTSFWPPAEGWLLLGALIVVALIWILVACVQSWMRNRYRRAALSELDQIRESSFESNQQRIAAIDRLLKRVAIVSWPRESVAFLSGRTWHEFLQRTCNQPTMPGDRIEKFENSVYSSKVSDAISDHDLDALFESSRYWIKNHRSKDSSEPEVKTC